VTVVLDLDMMRHDRLNYHPLENTATTNIARETCWPSSGLAGTSRASWL
jgi:Ala-tRNA(Pro) deacylase